MNNYFHAIFLFLLLSSFSSAGKTLTVGKQRSYSTIRAAVQASVAGDTVLVFSGTYREHELIIDKSISIIGSEWPVIDGENKSEIIRIQSDKVLLKGFHVRNSGIATLQDPAGIRVLNSQQVVIRDNYTENTFFGIYLQYAKNCKVINNRLTSNGKQEQQIGNGIHCWRSDSLLIEGNTITGHRDGIYFEFVTNSRIINNRSYKNIRYGLHFMFSNNDDYIRNNFIDNGAGVAVMFSHEVHMYQNTFEKNWGDAAYGLLLKEISDSRIENNRFIENTTGIVMEGASRITVLQNNFRQNGWAMKIQASSMDVTVHKNNFSGNSFDIATNGSLMLNSISNNYWDKYEGYDLDHDNLGDVPYRPISLFSMIVEKLPESMILFRSTLVDLLDKTEKIIPSMTPENMVDKAPLMRPVTP